MLVDKIIELYIDGLNRFKIRYSNKEKILIYFKYWICYFEYLFNSNLNGEFIPNNSNCTLYDIKYKQNINKRNKLKIISINFLNIFFQLFNFKIGILPGGLSKSFLSKLSYYSLRAKLDTIDFSINNDFKLFFLENAKDFMTDDKYSSFIALIPNIFFTNDNIYSNKLKTDIFRGSPACFMGDRYNYLKILFLNQKINLIGIQHGGGFSEWKIRTAEVMEKNISNIYYSWQFIDPCISQNRYYRKIIKTNSSNKILWIGREISTKNSTPNFIDYFEDHQKITYHVKYFKNILDEFNLEFLPHPNNTVTSYNEIFNNCKRPIGKAEQILENYNLIIFDSIGHTLLFACIFYKIPFLILINNIPKDFLVSDAYEFYYTLKLNNLLFEYSDTTFNETLVKNTVNYLVNINKQDFHLLLDKHINLYFYHTDISEFTKKYTKYKY